MFYEQLKKFIPLIVLFIIILSLTTARQLYIHGNILQGINDFVGFFFIIFGSFKIINWPGFVEAYRMYDIIAKRSIVYAYLYPIIELSLGWAFLFGFYPMLTNVIMLTIMLISSIGVIKELVQKREIVCACLGAVFKIPMTWVTLFEDLLMASMALIMLIFA